MLNEVNDLIESASMEIDLLLKKLEEINSSLRGNDPPM